MPQTATRARFAERYQLKQKLGVGASATVWLARDRATGRRVCIKQLHEHLARDEQARARLEIELSSAARIDHPAVVPVIEAELDRSRPAVVFPFVEGETLAARLARHGRLEPHEAAAIGAQVGSALAAAHAAEVVHRDVKPSNILLGADGVTRLLDFGVSRALDAADRELTGAGMTVGTLPYMAPEQLAGERPQPANDVFSLGAVLYQTLGGAVPFPADTPLELARLQREGPADMPDVPHSLAQLVLAALGHDPASRPSGAELARSLEDWHAGKLDSEAPTVATAAVPAHRPKGAAARARVTFPAGVALGAFIGLLALALVGAFWFAPPEGEPPENASQSALVPEKQFVAALAPGEAEADEVTTDARSGGGEQAGSGEKSKDKAKGKAKGQGKEKDEGKKGKGKGKGGR